MPRRITKKVPYIGDKHNRFMRVIYKDYQNGKHLLCLILITVPRRDYNPENPRHYKYIMARLVKQLRPQDKPAIYTEL